MHLGTKRCLAGLCAGLLAGLVGGAGPAPAADREGGQKVEVGKPAPPIELEATQVGKVLPGKEGSGSLSLKDLHGKNVVLYFFPKAMTPGCTAQSCGFRDLTREFAKLDTVVVGISTDRLDAQEQFTQKEKLNFPLLADPDKKIAREYGVLAPARGVAQRTTFVIDKKGIVRKIYRNVNARNNPDEVLRYVKENLADRE